METIKNSIPYKLVSWDLLPNSNVFHIPSISSTPIKGFPFQLDSKLISEQFFPLSLHYLTPVSVAFVYFITVHAINKVVARRQEQLFLSKNPNKAVPKRLPAAPYPIAQWKSFKVFVFLHNVALCAYSVWSLVGMTWTIYVSSHELIPNLIGRYYSLSSKLSPVDLFWQSVCDIDHGIWYNQGDSLKGLSFYSYLFYLSKYYEIVDTVIILLKGRQASLLQSYHHSGAILSMWAGTRFASPPIWIFVVFNSFIHSIMYFYFSLSCLGVRLGKFFKQTLTTLQICQFVFGGSLAVVHLFVQYFDVLSGSYKSCISTSEEALAIFINVFYLTPLTVLFAAFYIDSYKRKDKVKTQ
ncbi:hypothetical protein OGAPHI_006640 [Ogataea philodendri]|uniref:Elongation of fatty acids protein n=1 Tax=Ogataea philodendri TaxID=1378263 RepID=A0A9P8T002_9ASCO|nr:uncharacterized protein OGAPHI_006640 [Ogataea philodendri]KAH3661233.1 hypothetical protein OGAPHI_006640 [Ogataea philodendri]